MPRGGSSGAAVDAQAACGTGLVGAAKGKLRLDPISITVPAMAVLFQSEKKWIETTRDKTGNASDLEVLQKTFDKMK